MLKLTTTAATMAAAVAVIITLTGTGFAQEPARSAMAKKPIRLMTLDPGHFHAALIHRERYPDVADRVDVYGPLGIDLTDHLKRVARFNLRPDAPTAWQLEVHASPDFLDRLKKERPGNVVVISGRNRGKIDYVAASVAAGFHALVDKPWILRAADLPKLKTTLDLAEKNGRVAFDMMTERFEITAMLQKELVNDPDVFGKIVPGTADAPAVYMESVHHLMKVVAGVPNLRPTWFFDTEQQGEGLNDVGTHLVDLVPWTLFPGQGVDADKELKLLSAQRWPTPITLANFQRVTGEKDFPDDIKAQVKNGSLDYFCNTLVAYTVRGIAVKLNVIWDWEAPAGGGDTHFAFYRGSRARIESRQTKADKMRPELFVIPADAKDRAAVAAAVKQRLAAIQKEFPGVGVEDRGAELHITIPDKLRTVHEDHFAQVAGRFFGYVKAPKTLPAWERAHMLAKYWVTTKGTELARTTPVKVAERIAPK